MYATIIVKLIAGMICLLFFLRLAGKSQMAQMTPMDTVNSFVVGAIVGGIIYSPTLTIWDMLFAIAIWIIITLGIRYFSRFAIFNNLIHGKPEYVINNGEVDLKALQRNNIGIEQLVSKLRQREIYSLLDVESVCFEVDGQLSVTKKKKTPPAFLLVCNGEIMEEDLKRSEQSESWLRKELEKLQFSKIEDLFCVQWTPERGFFVIDKEGNTYDSTQKEEKQERKKEKGVTTEHKETREKANETKDKSEEKD